MPPVRSSDDRRRGLIVLLRPGPDLNLGMRRRDRAQGACQRQHHKQARMAMESLVQEWTRYDPGLVHQELSFDAMNAWGLLQGLDHVREQPGLYVVVVRRAAPIADEKVSNDALTSFVNKECI